MTADTLILSDTHFSNNSKIEQQKWYPGYVSLLTKLGPWGKRKAQQYLQDIDQRTQQDLTAVLAHVKTKYPQISTVVHCGDVVAGSNESGICNEASIKEFALYEQTVNTYFPEVQKFYGWGNHDMGYHEASKWGRVFSKRIGGVNQRSLENAQRLLGKPFFVTKLANLTLVFVNTELARLHPQTHEGEVTKVIRNFSQQQQVMLSAEMGKHENIILIGHDPIMLCKNILPVIDTSRVKLLLAGHVHNKKFAQILKLRFKIARQLNLHIIPSTWPSILNKKTGYGLLDSSTGEIRVESL